MQIFSEYLLLLHSCLEYSVCKTKVFLGCTYDVNVIDFWKFAYGVQGKIGLPCLSWGASGKSRANSFPYLGNNNIVLSNLLIELTNMKVGLGWKLTNWANIQSSRKFTFCPSFCWLVPWGWRGYARRERGYLRWPTWQYCVFTHQTPSNIKQ